MTNGGSIRTLIARQEALSKLVGARLTSVQFVLNYLILGFDEKGALTTLVWPKLRGIKEEIAFGMEEYRNVLCSLIECKVATASIGHDEEISIQFDNGAALRIELATYKGRGERAIFTAPNSYLLVF
jgi:hypothetical protein